MLPRLLEPHFGLLDDGVSLVWGSLSTQESLLPTAAKVVQEDGKRGRFHPVHWAYLILQFPLCVYEPVLWFLVNWLLLTAHTLDAAQVHGVKRYLFTSSGCIYPEFKQTEADVIPLKEQDAYPAQPQDAYGWEKLIAERLCIHYQEELGIETRIVRFHNIFGPLGSWNGGREKAPAALCRKVAAAKLTGNPEVEIWGDGEQTRSFCYIDDCVEGIYRLMQSDYSEPLNLGQDRLVTINQLLDMIAEIAGIDVVKKHIPGPQGVRGRNSDNSLLNQTLNWEPQVSLETGLQHTYTRIAEQVKA